jgi:hypothetical protein
VELRTYIAVELRSKEPPPDCSCSIRRTGLRNREPERRLHHRQGDLDWMPWNYRATLAGPALNAFLTLFGFRSNCTLGASSHRAVVTEFRNSAIMELWT